MAKLNPITVGRVAGKEPLFAVITVVLVGIISYAIFTSGPDYISKKQRQLKSMQKEIVERRRSEAIREYQATFDRVYAPLIDNAQSERFKSSAIIMDEVRQALRQHDLKLINLNRSRNEKLPITASQLDTSFAYINVLVEGDFYNALNFIRNFGENGPFRRVIRFNASSPAADRMTKFTLTLMIPTSDIERL